MNASRNTVQRDMVLNAVREMHNHPTADEIYQNVTHKHPSVSKATVYRNLNLLAERGDIRRVSHLNAADRFDFDLHPHYHFCCKGCGGVFDVDIVDEPNLLQQVHNTDDFLFEEYDIVFSGLCPHCYHNRADA